MSTDIQSDNPIAVDIPVGYHLLPLNDIDETFRSAAPILDSLSSAVAPGITEPLADGLQAMLHALRDLGALYCGVGRHNNGDGTYAVSWLVISLADHGSPRNPRLRVAEIAAARRGPDTTVHPAALGARPMVLIESKMEPPNVTGRRPPNARRIEAIVPCDDGRRVAAITVTTLSAAHLPILREILLSTAASIRFDVTEAGRSRLDLPPADPIET